MTEQKTRAATRDTTDWLKVILHLSSRIRAHVDRRFADVDARLAAIEATGLKYAGTWQRAGDYQRGAVVTDQGSAWVALKASAGERPGDVPAAWQLLVKAGRDGRDAAPAPKTATAVKLKDKS